MAGRSILRRALVVCTALGLGFVALVGVAHTPAGRPLLRYLPGMGSTCPHGALDVASFDRVRGKMLDRVRGEGQASSREAFGFTLGESTRADVEAWAASGAIDCAPAGRASLRCSGAGASMLDAGGGAAEVLFELDANDRLAAVDVSLRLRDADAAARVVDARTARLRARLGAPSWRRGEASAAHLAFGPLRQTAVEYRRADLRASVVATNVGAGGFAVRELYQAI